MATEELLSAGKVAEKLGVPQTKVKNIIKELGIEPDAKKGVCAMYNSATIEKIKGKL
jgi:hypothetical protein